MRFQRHQRHPYTATELKTKAILRRQRREREAYPLFAEEIGQSQVAPELEHERRRLAWDVSEREERAQRAKDWRRARTELSGFPPAERARLLDHWNRHRWYPATPMYLLSMLHMHRHGRLNLDLPGMTLPRVAQAQRCSDPHPTPSSVAHAQRCPDPVDPAEEAFR